MTNKESTRKFLEVEMNRFDLSGRTIPLYTSWVMKLMDYYPGKDIKKLTFNEVHEFVNHHIRANKFSPSSINIALNSLVLLYNRIWKKNYPFETIVKPKVQNIEREFLKEDEVLALLDATKNIKHRAMLTVAYSAGLEVSQLKNLKISDLDFERSQIKVRDAKGKLKRNAVLAKAAKPILKEYLKEYKPIKFVFEGSKPNKPYGETTLNKILVDNLSKAGIHRKMTFRSLKYSYAMHLHAQGVPLIRILEHLGIDHSTTLVIYSKLDAIGKKSVEHSPLDQLSAFANAHQTTDAQHLVKAIEKIKNKDERDYLIEALRCIENSAVRAGIIFAWTAAILNIRRKCLARGKSATNNARIKHEPSSRQINSEEDFSYIKDRTTLLIAKELGIYDKSEKDILTNHLDLRNLCGHPSKYRPDGLKAASFLSDLLSLVFAR